MLNVKLKTILYFSFEHKIYIFFIKNVFSSFLDLIKTQSCISIRTTNDMNQHEVDSVDKDYTVVFDKTIYTWLCDLMKVLFSIKNANNRIQLLSQCVL